MSQECSEQAGLLGGTLPQVFLQPLERRLARRDDQPLRAGATDQDFAGGGADCLESGWGKAATSITFCLDQEVLA
jgi:hypothetical protein